MTLISDQPITPYSGMLPGHIAGLYTREAMHIDLASLARRTGTCFIQGRAVGLDRAQRLVLLEGQDPVRYDTLALDVGITPDLRAIEGAELYGLPVKPISQFLSRLDRLLEAIERADGPRHLAIVGGGAAGVELAIALSLRFKGRAAISLISSDRLVPGLNDGARRYAVEALRAADVTFYTGSRLVQMQAQELVLADGRHIRADASILSTAARAPHWLAETGLSCAADGSLLIHPTLQTCDDDNIFASGDCAEVIGEPRPKAGVFAVRQGPVLAANLRRHVMGQQLVVHRAQRQFLTLLLSGKGEAIAGRGAFLALRGRWIWRWKDWIDRRFMARFSG